MVKTPEVSYITWKEFWRKAEGFCHTIAIWYKRQTQLGSWPIVSTTAVAHTVSNVLSITQFSTNLAGNVVTSGITYLSCPLINENKDQQFEEQYIKFCRKIEGFCCRKIVIWSIQPQRSSVFRLQSSICREEHSLECKLLSCGGLRCIRRCVLPCLFHGQT